MFCAAVELQMVSSLTFLFLPLLAHGATSALPTEKPKWGLG